MTACILHIVVCAIISNNSQQYLTLEPTTYSVVFYPATSIMTKHFFSNYCLQHKDFRTNYLFPKNTNHQQMHKESFIINCNTLLHVSTLLGHLPGELFCYRYTKVALYSWVRMFCWLCTVYWRRELSAVPACRPGPQTVHASKNNAVHSQQHILTLL
jgi:hypothetical protein